MQSVRQSRPIGQSRQIDHPSANVQIASDPFPKAVLICGRYDWPLDKSYQGHVIALYHVEGTANDLRLILLANYAG
jgi:hypothetical protein